MKGKDFTNLQNDESSAGVAQSIVEPTGIIHGDLVVDSRPAEKRVPALKLKAESLSKAGGQGSAAATTAEPSLHQMWEFCCARCWFSCDSWRNDCGAALATEVCATTSAAINANANFFNMVFFLLSLD
jgi:hypothetical protein